MGETWRLFVALPLSGAVKAGLSAYQRALAAAGVRARWVREPQFHITLKFLGDVEASAVSSLIEALQGEVQRVPGFEVTLCGVGAFPNERTPRVLWAALPDPPRELNRLAEAVEAGCLRLGFPRSEKPFRPHVTLGRLRAADAPTGWEQVAASLGDRPLAPERMCRVILYRSHLAPSGPTYTELASAPLAPE